MTCGHSMHGISRAGWSGWNERLSAWAGVETIGFSPLLKERRYPFLMQPRMHIAMVRFGLGARLGQPMPDDGQAWVARQLRALPVEAGLTTAQGLASIRSQRANPGGEPLPGGDMRPADIMRVEAAIWARRMLATDTPVAERLADFWGNHFTVSRRQGNVAALLGAYQREAIRPHVFGRFEHMLLAVVRHPAMIMYLDNGGSAGPNSRANERRNRGLNENLAREILELHTLGVRGGYSQEDVTSFAKVLTGWSVGRGTEFNEPEGFMFRPFAHDPGPKQLMGREFAEGEEGGMSALSFLANHTSTHRMLATKLVRHFVRDDPPEAVIRRIAQVLAETHGDLATATRALFALPEAWAPLTKVRAPQDFAIAVLRALGAGDEAAQPLLGAMANFAQPLWTAPGPNGWPDAAGEWASPEQLMRRLDWVNGLAGRAAAAGRPDARDVAEATLGPLLKAETMTAVRRAGSAREALLLLLASPEFQRR